MNPEWKARYDLACEVGKKAGDEARVVYDSSFEVEWKADKSPVTVADKKAEEVIRAAIKKHFPNDAFLGEESGSEPGTTGYRWIIDPIDGTRSFVRHIPIWATLIGLEYKGEHIGGVAYIPCMNELYHALRGNGAYSNNRRIRVSDVSAINKSLMCYSSINWFRKAGREDTFLNLTAKTERQRGYGDFYGFVLVAQGSAEIMFEHGVNPWDIAATKAIVEEAGGTFTDWNGVNTIDKPDVLATNGKLHNEVLNLLKMQPASAPTSAGLVK